MVTGPWSSRHATGIWAAAAFLPPTVGGLLSLGRPVIQDSHATLVLVLVVAVISAAGLAAAGVSSAITAALAYDYFWTEPYGSLVIRDLSDIITVALLLIVAVASSRLSQWAAHQQASAAQRRNYLAAIQTVAAASSASHTPGDGLAGVSEAIRAVLGADRCRVVQGESPGSIRLCADGTVTQAGRVLDVDRWGLPTDDLIVLAVGGVDEATVHFAVSAASQVARPSVEQRQVAALMARLAGAGLPTLH